MITITLTQPVSDFREQRWPAGPELLFALDIMLMIADVVLFRVYA